MSRPIEKREYKWDVEGRFLICSYKGFKLATLERQGKEFRVDYHLPFLTERVPGVVNGLEVYQVEKKIDELHDLWFQTAGNVKSFQFK